MTRNANDIGECHETAQFELHAAEMRSIDVEDDKAVERFIERLEESVRREMISCEMSQYLVSRLCERRSHEEL